jgi:hypothetical protein
MRRGGMDRLNDITGSPGLRTVTPGMVLIMEISSSDW